ncbi:MAG TPA: glycosyltransferase [Mycobacteriales bacterium]|nr:glycosyltransferase [Mycobacteriales bacterium]
MPGPAGRPLFVCWTRGHARSTALAAALDAEILFVADAILRPVSSPLRYLRSTWRTWRAVRRSAPASLIVMVPPTPAAVTGWLLARRRGIPLVLDLHTGAVNDPKWTWSWPAVRAVARRARLTVVTTERLAEHLRAQGIRVSAVHDPPLAATPAGRAHARPTVVVAAGWNNDEPVAALADAARRLDGIRILVTGAPPPAARDALAGLVELTGWLAEPDYLAQIAGADVVVALTTRELTMQRGGYEALDCHRPLVTSDTAVLRDFFGPAAVYTTADGAGIAAAVTEALRRPAELSAAMAALHAERLAAWPGELAALTAALSGRDR